MADETRESKTPLAEIMGTLDEIATAKRANDLPRMIKAILLAGEQGCTHHQIVDAVRWGSR